MTAHVATDLDDQGVLYTTGNENAGLALFVKDNLLIFDYNAFGDHTTIESNREIPSGASHLGVRVRRGDQRSGTAELVIDGEPVGSASMPLLMGVISSIGASVGYSHASAVSEKFVAPFPFTGTLHDVTIQISPDRYPTADQAQARMEMGRQ